MSPLGACYNMIMFIVGLLGWWYGPGWQQAARRVSVRLAGTADFFSIGLLLRTLFAPFRQISAGSVRGSLSVVLHAWLDKLISRLIGAMVRSAMIVTGVLILALQGLVGGLLIIGWLFVPLLPLVGGILAAIGWLPW